VPVQTVDATPSGIKLFSKVVFMKQGKRFGLSAEQKLDVWRRWKAGQTLQQDEFPHPPLSPYYMHVSMSFSK
jgi:hypothetical protein